MDGVIVKRRAVSLAVLALMVVLVWWPDLFSGSLSWGAPVCDTHVLCVVFLDVGQGDAIFIQLPSGQQLLIDTGRDQSVLRELGEVMSFSDRDLNYLLLTHPDADHVGGAAEILERYAVAKVIRTENESDSAL